MTLCGSEKFGTKGPAVRPYDPGFFLIPLIGTRNGNDYFLILLELQWRVCQDERAFVADVFDGALKSFPVYGKRDLPVPDGSFNFSLFIHGRQRRPYKNRGARPPALP